MSIKSLTAFILAVATLLGAVGTLLGQIREMKKDQIFAWDNFGDQVAEVERLKERLAALEGGRR